MQKEITFVYTKDTHVVSLSGGGCALSCSHCNKHYIEQMPTLENAIPAYTKSFLISGGLDKNGKSFIQKRHQELAELKKKGNYRFNSHVGFVDENEIDNIKEVVDFVSFDFVSDSDVIKRVYHLDKSVDEYVELYKLLKSKVETYPHITIGLDEGKIHWEYKAIDILHDIGSDRLVLNVLIPTEGTDFENVDPPDLDEVRQVFQYARKIFNKELLIVGCMRPKGAYREAIDVMAVEEGVDRIVQPTPKARALAFDLGHKISHLYECCAMDPEKKQEYRI